MTDKQKIAELQQGINLCHVAAKRLEIKTVQDMNAASRALGLCNNYIKRVKSEFKDLIEKAFQAHRAATGMRERHLKPVEMAKTVISSKMSVFEADERRRGEEEEDREPEEELQRPINVKKRHLVTKIGSEPTFKPTIIKRDPWPEQETPDE